MKVLITILIFPFPLVLFSQEIQYVDTTIKEGYFYLIESDKRQLQERCAVGKKDEFYFIDERMMGGDLDSIFYSQRYIQEDTIKYLFYTPDIKESGNFFPKRFSNKNALNMYEEGISLQTQVKPINYFQLPVFKKPFFHHRIGLTYIKAKWLHLRIVDKITFLFFNNPPTLADPHVKERYYDVYIPMSVLEINKDVKINNKRKIYLGQP